MGRKTSTPTRNDLEPVGSLAAFARPNPDRSHFNRFDAGNLSVVERTGKHKHIRRLYCAMCKRRFTERQGTLLRYSKRPEETAVRIVKCLGHGCSVEATADFCEVDPRAVDRIRRKRRHGRREDPGLKPPPGLLAGVVHKVRDASGNVVGMKAEALFGRLKAIEARVAAPGIGTTVVTSHLERLVGALRCQQARLARRPRCVPRDGRRLPWSLWLWRDLYHWVRGHRSLHGRTPAMAIGLSDRAWSVLVYVRHPVHVSELDRAIGAEERQEVLTSAPGRQKARKSVPSS